MDCHFANKYKKQNPVIINHPILAISEREDCRDFN